MSSQEKDLTYVRPATSWIPGRLVDSEAGASNTSAPPMRRTWLLRQLGHRGSDVRFMRLLLRGQLRALHLPRREATKVEMEQIHVGRGAIMPEL